MSLFEWFLKPTNPGPVGSVNVDTPESDDGKPPKKWSVWLTSAVGLFVTGVGLYWVFYNLSYAGAGPVILKLCCLTLYVLISHRITAKPDYTNVGWLGGLFDNPFRISDDANRWLIYLQALLFPGKLMAYSVVISYLVVKHLYKRRKK